MSVPTINHLATSHSPITCANVKCSHGRCVMVNRMAICECKLGYMGDTCSDTINEALSLPLTLGTLVCIIAFLFLIFVLAFVRQRQKIKQRKRAAEEALRRNGAHV